MSRILITALICLPLLAKAGGGAADDTTHSPKKASIYSAVIPGLGQAYNHKYWKIPIIWAAMGTSVYFIIDNNRNYHQHRDEYLYRINNNGLALDPELEGYSESQLRTLLDQYRRWRDLSYVATGIFYALNIVDAAVDGYFWRFDTSTDLSFRIRPTFISTAGITPGLRFGIKF